MRETPKNSEFRTRSSLDFLALVGVMISVGAIVAGNLMEGAPLASLAQPTAFVVVVGGTIGAVMLQTPLADCRRALLQLRFVLLSPSEDRAKTINHLVEWSRTARKDGLLALERTLKPEQDPLLQKGIRLLVDGAEPDEIAATLDVYVETRLAAGLRGAQVYEALGGYAPTIGILGAVLGLIQVMNSLSDPGALGAGIAIAFVATIYGVGLANLFFLPVANKLRALCTQHARYQDMIIAGLVMIADGDNPQFIRNRLEGYLE